jgi:hypothetical protein
MTAKLDALRVFSLTTYGPELDASDCVKRSEWWLIRRATGVALRLIRNASAEFSE